MKVKVKSVVIDFTDDVCDCPPDTTSQESVIQYVLNTEWIVDDEEELVDMISDDIGWCIYKIDYEILSDTKKIQSMNGSELEEFLYDACREHSDLLEYIISQYVCSLSDNKLIELEDFLTNNFWDD
jgi:hypothetical protein